MKSIDENLIIQDSGDYGKDVTSGKRAAVQFIKKLQQCINDTNYTGEERHSLSDKLFGHAITGGQVGFCYELICQIEPLLLAI